MARGGRQATSAPVARVVESDFAQGIPSPYRREVGGESMNQTESRRKVEGSGVGILCVSRPATSSRQHRLSPMAKPRLKLSPYLTAPDDAGLRPARRARNQERRNDYTRGRRNFLAGRPQFTVVATRLIPALRESSSV